MRHRIFAVLAAAPLCVTAWILACGPDWPMLETVTQTHPSNRTAYDAGQLGVVRAQFDSRDLARAYRVLSGRPALRVDYLSAGLNDNWKDAWEGAKTRAIGRQDPRTGRTLRVTQDFQATVNCLDDAFATASATLMDRRDQFGQDSKELRDWTLAQDAVFANCDEEPLVLPAPATPDADPLLIADRAYQTAAAYFYAGQYDESEKRFLAIGADQTSPWHPYGRFLAARSMIRRATTVSGPPVTDGLSAAERLLNQVLADSDATVVHASARRLVNFIAARVRPGEQLKKVSQQVATSTNAVDALVLEDFRWLVNHQPEGAIDDDLVNWVLAMQVGNGDAFDTAIAKWENTRSNEWLSAVLWHMPPKHPSAPAALAAAAAVSRQSPAFASVTFSRVRLLIRLGQLDDARKVLAALPDKPAPGIDIETVNLLDGERLMVAQTLEQFIAAAPRSPVVMPYVKPEVGPIPAPPAFDEDAAITLSARFPLDRLLVVAQSAQLPARLKSRVAVAAYTRAIVLGREDIALKVAPTLAGIAPALRNDLDRYVKAGTAIDRQRAAILLILRTPGMKLRIQGLDTEGSLDPEPARTFGDFSERWWCGDYPNVTPPPVGTANSELINLLYPNQRVPYPSFITSAERAMTEKELASLKQAGHAAPFLARAVISWAKAKPTDPEAAEALSRIVKGWPKVCRDPSDFALSRRAFQMLHNQFPTSTWAAQTPYWYK